MNIFEVLYLFRVQIQISPVKRFSGAETVAPKTPLDARAAEMAA